MIYGPGGYTTTDFLVFGSPMQIVLWIASIIFLVLHPWYISWIITFVILVVVVAARVFNSTISDALKKRKHNE
jgi:hypothetical protein